MIPKISLIGITGFPEIYPGDNLANYIVEATINQETPLSNRDILVVVQKVVSKSEGQIVKLSDIEPSSFAIQIAYENNRDPRHMEVILRESKRIVKMDRGVLITETKHGHICANAGVDVSNVLGDDYVTLLPKDPDASAEHIRRDIRKLTKLDIAVVITDTFNRPWRLGSINVALGVAGINPLRNYQGKQDAYGYELKVSMAAIADELASAAELIASKLSRIPVVIVRGLKYDTADSYGRALVRDPLRDLFR